MQLGGLNAVHVAPEKKRAGRDRPPVLLLHGLGLGAWVWASHQAALAEAGLESYAVDLPGHGADAGADVGLEDVVKAARRAAEALGTPALVGHAMGSLVAQSVATKIPLACLVLVSPLPPAGVRFWPTREGLRAVAPRLPGLALGRPLAPVDAAMSEEAREALGDSNSALVAERMTAWPAQLTRDLIFDRPEIPRDGIACPVLVTFGFQDTGVRLSTVRLIGDYYNALTWRFDDLARLPMLEGGADRHARKLAEWLRNPRRRRVDEIDTFAPDEGVGQDVREQRRGFRRRRTKVD